ncbi:MULTISPECIES: PAS domain-containing protein [Rhodopseudomonas]|uniref:histidine kinase n=1 Tax=Rhodopseudomonas palustris TaxID=1076 RepID=A0A0D7EJH3_RHOPL|nr:MULTISPECIES: PAS domain-containing protein [Rhodopseudomonas]KIZ39652.1 histidine kinase [Rhodopseudomonas palustris]MDF3810777.1 PAS domain S-box protein [Rhodopseudomonas sp. BAL398]WOK20578.1 PAS domain S-box protein [Rhodopseudomonas sp. BAL398]
MTKLTFQLPGMDDPRLAIHATSALPVWLWSHDGSRVIWANPVGARLLGAPNGAALAEATFGPANPQRRQVAQLSRNLPPNEAVRLERLRGFGARLGALLTCACARLTFADGTTGILIAAVESVGRPLPLTERLRKLVEGIDTPIAAFARDGLFLGSSDAARTLLGFRNLTEAGLEAARDDALRLGRAETPIGIGHLVLQRVGTGADVGLIALLVPGAVRPDSQSAATPQQPHPKAEPPPRPNEPTAAEPPVAEPPAFDYETAMTTTEAPSEYALLDQGPPMDVAREAAGAVLGEPDPAGRDPAAPVEAAEATNSKTTDNGDDARESEMPAVAPAPEPPSDPALAGAAISHQPRRHPLRFVWQMDAEGRFAIGTDEFSRLIGPRTTAAFGRPWSEITETFGLDPEGRIAAAIASRQTWSGITVLWPTDGEGPRPPVELSGLPVQDQDGNFVGYRGFGVCRDLDGLNSLAATRRAEDQPHPPQPLSAGSAPADAEPAPPGPPVLPEQTQPAAGAETVADANGEVDAAERPCPETPHQEQSETSLDTPRNVLPFRPVSEPKSPALTPVENSAFDELARQLSARLESDGIELQPSPDTVPEDPAQQAPDWLIPLATPAQGVSSRDRTLLDLLPVGVLIYRLDRLVYANAAFLARIGYASLQALEQAGGLDALLVEAGVTGSSSTCDAGTPITIAAPDAGDAPSQPAHGRLHTISWDGESALALIFDGAPQQPAAAADIVATPAVIDAPSAVGAANAEELGAILDTTAEGIVMFDEAGQLTACNRSAEALFGYEGDELVQRNLIDLFAPESQREVGDYLDSIKRAGVASLLEHGREALGRVREGGLIPLTLTMGRTRADGPNFFAVFRDLSQVRKTETELAQAQRQADRAATAKADVLARISHEVRTPLNAIIGFAEVMIDQRFGALGNERYVEYMKDIRASGERVIAIVDDMLDLSRIETGKLDLAFASQNLNELIEHCVAVTQPQANRERIIIRTSLAHQLPPVVADPQALRQITLNLIGTSIHLANAGGQVIVSTALNDFGDVVLRVRDTGHRLNDDELAAAMRPFHTPAPSDRAEASGASLALTKALVEANHAQFHIKSAPHSGTLIEVVFSRATARASY